MLQAFIITLREGVEAALIIGITLAYLNKIQRQDLRRAVYVALASAFVASIGVAILVSRFQFSQDLFEGWVMLAAAVFGASTTTQLIRRSSSHRGSCSRTTAEAPPWSASCCTSRTARSSGRSPRGFDDVQSLRRTVTPANGCSGRSTPAVRAADSPNRGSEPTLRRSSPATSSRTRR